MAGKILIYVRDTSRGRVAQFRDLGPGHTDTILSVLYVMGRTDYNTIIGIACRVTRATLGLGLACHCVLGTDPSFHSCSISHIYRWDQTVNCFGPMCNGGPSCTARYTLPMDISHELQTLSLKARYRLYNNLLDIPPITIDHNSLLYSCTPV